MSDETVFRPGLKGVVLAESDICLIDGERGRLRYRGYDIQDLADHSTFEETTYLLLEGRLPTDTELRSFGAELARQRALSTEELGVLAALPEESTPMDALRTMMSAIGGSDAHAEDTDETANRRKALRSIAVVPTILAGYHRLREGLEPIAPREDLGHAANFLHMMTGEPPDETSARVFDVCLVLHADHGFNASTFAARVAASTLGDVYSAMTAAIATLIGPLHGGANARVLDMLEGIGDVERVRGAIEAKLANKERIWGLGHRVYKAKDPRAVALESLIDELASARGESRLYRVAKEVETVGTEMLGDKGIYPNVDFYSGVCYNMLGIPTDLFTPIFAMGRISGWATHVLEQYAENVLIRPLGHYTGPELSAYTPLEER
ncbi:MAG: citrate/2-methylcitrate synthase [Candidatus Bipolaricaulia bacterium]